MPSAYQEPVARLLALGRPVRGEASPDYAQLGLTAEYVPELLRLAQDQELLDADSEGPEVWGPTHAWLALGQLRAEAAIGPLLGLLDRADTDDTDDSLLEDIPTALADIGSVITPAIQDYLAVPAHGLWARNTVARTLGQLAQKFPETRAPVIAILTAELRHYEEQDPTLNASYIDVLGDLRATEAADLVKAAYDAEAVDTMMIGKWEEAGYRLGALAEPPPPPPGLAERLAELIVRKPGSEVLSPVSHHHADPKKKAKRKQAKASRQHNRRHKH